MAVERVDAGFDADVRRRVGEFLDAKAPLIIFTDFDGTISNIVSGPPAARVLPLARSALRRLTRIAERGPRALRVYVVSGRPAADVAERVRVGGLTYLGLHGSEVGRLARGQRPESMDVQAADGVNRQDVAARAADASGIGVAVAALLGVPRWLYVENKGPAVAFHFRDAPAVAVAREMVRRAIGDALETGQHHDWVTMEGRDVVELNAPGVGGKGRVAESIIASVHPGAMLLLGDDRTDADAFRVAVAARRRGQMEALAVAVGGGSETPTEIIDTADIILRGPADAARLLSFVGRQLLQRAQAPSSRGGVRNARQSGELPIRRGR